MSEDDPLIGRYCGTQVPAPITSTSNVLYVRFVADYTVHKAGFNATYQQQDGEDLSITFCILKVQGQVSVIFIKKNMSKRKLQFSKYDNNKAPGTCDVAY